MEANVDDDVFSPPGAFYRTSMRHQQKPTPLPPPAFSSIWHRIMWFMDFFTGPTFGIVVALVVILVLQYKPNITALFENIMENGVRGTLVDCSLGLCDLARAYYQITCEIIRNFWVVGAGSRHPSTVLNTPTPERQLAAGIPPPLVVTHFLAGAGSHSEPSASCLERPPSPSLSSSSSTAHNMPDFTNQTIEPAFLDDDDYPEGWLVYHPKLGVVSKREADEYDRKAIPVLQ